MRYPGTIRLAHSGRLWDFRLYSSAGQTSARKISPRRPASPSSALNSYPSAGSATTHRLWRLRWPEGRSPDQFQASAHLLPRRTPHSHNLPILEISCNNRCIRGLRCADDIWFLDTTQLSSIGSRVVCPTWISVRSARST